MWIGASEAVPRLAPGSAGVSPARLKNNRHVDSKGFATEDGAAFGRAPSAARSQADNGSFVQSWDSLFGPDPQVSK